MCNKTILVVEQTSGGLTTILPLATPLPNNNVVSSDLGGRVSLCENQDNQDFQFFSKKFHKCTRLVRWKCIHPSPADDVRQQLS